MRAVKLLKKKELFLSLSGGGGYVMFSGTPKDARWTELRRSFGINNIDICIQCTLLVLLFD
jgi:hypothetical protein